MTLRVFGDLNNRRVDNFFTHFQPKSIFKTKIFNFKKSSGSPKICLQIRQCLWPGTTLAIKFSSIFHFFAQVAFESLSIFLAPHFFAFKT